MAVHLRLTRMGSHKRPFYRVIAIDSRTKRDGEYIELIGTHDVLKGETKLKKDIAMKWLNLGAQPSDTVRDLFSKDGIMKTFAEAKDANKKSKKSIKKVSKAKTITKKVVAKPKSTTIKTVSKTATKKVEEKPKSLATKKVEAKTTKK